MRSNEFLKAQIKRRLGVAMLRVLLRWMNSRMIEMKGVMPLPPLIITSDSYLQDQIIFKTLKRTGKYSELILREKICL